MQSSRWSILAGVPVAFYGVLGYLAIVAVALVGSQPAYAARPGPTRLLALLSGGGLVFTLYLTGLELFVIHAFCRWCLASAAVIALIWVTAMLGLRKR